MKRLMSPFTNFVKFFYDKEKLEARRQAWNECIEERRAALKNMNVSFDGVLPIVGLRELF